MQPWQTARLRDEGWVSRRRKHAAAKRFILVALVLAAAAFAAGYFWKARSARLARVPLTVESAAVTPARKQALDFIDEAIRAKYEKRTSGVLSALDRARKTDPAAPGIDIAFAELALNEKQFIEMRAAAESAKRKNDRLAAASVLLGMDKWINRGASDRAMSSAADSAGVQFAEAADTDYFAAPPWFFWADVLRYAGNVSEGHDRALSALHRFQPWDSSDVLAAKVIAASAEAGETAFAGLGFLADSPFVCAVAGLATAQISASSAEKESAVGAASQATLQTLARDPFYRNSVPPSAGLPLLPR